MKNENSYHLHDLTLYGVQDVAQWLQESLDTVRLTLTQHQENATNTQIKPKYSPLRVVW